MEYLNGEKLEPCRDPALVAEDYVAGEALRDRKRAAEEWPFGFPKDTVEVVPPRDPLVVAAETLHDQILERKRQDADRDRTGRTVGDEIRKTMARQETVDHPAHYNAHPSGVECITVVEHMPFNVGNAVKYLWRAGEKPGVDAVEDLRKAAWYVAREIERRSK